MAFSFNKIHHLIRYFLLLALVFFVAYIKEWSDAIFFPIMGPPIYLAYYLKSFINPFIEFLEINPIHMNQFGYLLPVTLVYFGLVGFFFKQLWNEHGFFKVVSLIALSGFLVYVHYLSGDILLKYVTAIS